MSAFQDDNSGLSPHEIRARAELDEALERPFINPDQKEWVLMPDNSIIRENDQILLVDLIKKGFITKSDVERSQVLLLKIRGIFPERPLDLTSAYDRGLQYGSFASDRYIFRYLISDTSSGPLLEITYITDARRIKQIIIPNTKYGGLCNVCAAAIVPYSAEFDPVLEHPLGVKSKCPCMLTKYCGQDCQRKDWIEFGHKAVHTAIIDM